MKGWRQFVTLSLLTALETVRKPVSYLIMFGTMVLIGLFPLVLSQTLGETQDLVLDSALALHLVSGLLLGSYAAGSSLRRELRTGTAGAVLSKPVNRAIFFLSKFTGIALVLVIYSVALGLESIMSARIVWDDYRTDWMGTGLLWAALLLAQVAGGLVNYFKRRPFCSNALVYTGLFLAIAFLAGAWLSYDGTVVDFGTHYRWDIPAVSALAGLATVLLAALALTLSVRLEPLSVLSVCYGIFMLGLMSDYLFARTMDTQWISRMFYYLLPNWQHFWVADALRLGEPVPLAYIGRVLSYTMLYCAGVLGLGWALFRETEVK